MIGQYKLRLFLEVFVLEFLSEVAYFVLNLSVLDLQESVLVHFFQFLDIVLGFGNLNKESSTMRCGTILWVMLAATLDPTWFTTSLMPYIDNSLHAQ